jgi:hypothetical protein
MITVKEKEMDALLESAELILRGLTDGLRAIDTGKTTEARRDLGVVASQLASLKVVLQRLQLRGKN